MDPRKAWVSAVAPERPEVLEDRLLGDPARPLARLRLGAWPRPWPASRPPGPSRSSRVAW